MNTKTCKHEKYIGGVCVKCDYVAFSTPPVNESWRIEARNKVFNKLTFMGDQGQKYLDTIVFPYIDSLLSTARQEAKAERTEEIRKAIKGKNCGFCNYENTILEIIDSLTSI